MNIEKKTLEGAWSVLRHVMFATRTVLERGFGPATSNIFREMKGLEPVQWAIDKDLPTKVEFEEVRNRRWKSMKQTSLSDFLSK